MDEAQHLGEDSKITGEYKDDVRDLLNQIHNGKLGRPVILLAGGLGMPHAAFRALGISRMAENCKFDMKPLEEEEERQVIKDWLKRAGKAKGDTTDWIDVITQETYLWPRHVDSYAQNAAHLVYANDGVMTPELLRLVMEKGREKRMEYYQVRLDGFTAKECRSFARILLASSGEGGIEQEVAVDQLDKECGAGEGAELFSRRFAGESSILKKQPSYTPPRSRPCRSTSSGISLQKSSPQTWDWRDNLSPLSRLADFTG